MILPKGLVFYKNLRTSFVNFNEFLLALKDESFTGYVHLSFWDYEGVLFLEEGEIVNALEEDRGRRRGGTEAVRDIMARARTDKEGRIDAYVLSPELVTLLATLPSHEPLYTDLSTDFTNLGKLLEKLRREAFTGYITAELSGGRGRGMIFLQEGEPIEVLLEVEGGRGIKGVDELDEMVEEVQRAGAVLNVYRSTKGEEVQGREEAEERVGTALNLFQLLYSETAKVIDSMAKKEGVFEESFHKARVDLADTYAFLDPFMGELNFEEGSFYLSGDVSPDEFVRGIGEAYDLALEKVPLKASKGEIYEELRKALKRVLEDRREQWRECGFDVVLPELTV